MRDLIILPGAARYLKKLKEKALKDAFQKEIDAIRIDPYLGEAKTGDLAGIYCRDVFYSRTNYELAYTLIEKDNETVVVLLAGARENFYNELKRYMKNK